MSTKQVSSSTTYALRINNENADGYQSEGTGTFNIASIAVQITTQELETNYQINSAGTIIPAKLVVTIPPTILTALTGTLGYRLYSPDSANFKYSTDGGGLFPEILEADKVALNGDSTVSINSLKWLKTPGISITSNTEVTFLIYDTNATPSVSDTLTFKFELYLGSIISAVTSLAGLQFGSPDLTVNVYASNVTSIITTHDISNINIAASSKDTFSIDEPIVFLNKLESSTGTNNKNPSTINFTQLIPNLVNLDGDGTSNNGYIIVTNSEALTSLADAVADTTNSIVIAPADRATYGVTFTPGETNTTVSLTIPLTTDYATDVYAKVLNSTDSNINSPLYIWIAGKIAQIA